MGNLLVAAEFDCKEIMPPNIRDEILDFMKSKGFTIVEDCGEHGYFQLAIEIEKLNKILCGDSYE